MARLSRVFVPAGALLLLISEILLVAAAFVLATYFELTVDPTVFLLYDGGFEGILLVLLCILVGMYFRDLYSQIRVKSRVVLLQHLCMVFGFAFLMEGLIGAFAPSLRVPLRVMLSGSGIALAAIFAWRILFSALAPQMAGQDRLLLVGDLPSLKDVGSFIQAHPDTGLALAGYVDDSTPPGAPLPGGQALGPLSSLREIVRATHPRRVVVGVSDRRNQALVNDLRKLRFEGLLIEEVAGAYETVCGRVCLRELRPSQLIYSGEFNPQPRAFFYQTLRNMVLAGIAVILSSPVLLLTALAVKLSSSGPVLWRQTRTGLDGAPFTLYRFRSTRSGAEGPELTPVGRFICRLGFDRLPQLFNVLKGDMSIAGPSPERPEFVDALTALIPYYRQRNCVRPGITGWAQIRPGQGDAPEDAGAGLEYDLYYIKHMSLALDTFIFVHTLKGILLSGGPQ
ncbi:MAG: sugar transferase [Bryobacteraceae bacterium]|jgi:lipopolysaccharide/colanic/teichoic acid biosynthesis glycosyltransferase